MPVLQVTRLTLFVIGRLSEPNMGSISGQVEEMYMSNSRKDMNDALTEVLISACVTPALMTDRYRLILSSSQTG